MLFTPLKILVNLYYNERAMAMNLKQFGPWLTFVLLFTGAGVFGGYIISMFGWLAPVGVGLGFLILFIALLTRKGGKLAMLPMIFFIIFGYISAMLSGYLVATFSISAPLISGLLNGTVFYAIWTYVSRKKVLPT